MNKIKISFIGAGSFVFTFKLVNDIFRYKELHEKIECVFMDIDETRLTNLKTLLTEYITKNHLPVNTVFTTDLRKALEGARFVFNLVKIGFYEASVQDMDIPKKYGLQQTIGDTSCVSGIFRGIRTMPFTIKMAKIMEEISAENAIILNYTNPQPMLVMANAQASRIPFYGLCHSIQYTTADIGYFMNIPAGELDFEAAGINHLSWITRLERNGKDIYPELREIVKKEGIYLQLPPEKIDDDDHKSFLGPSRLDMLNRVGYIVTESSYHFSEYVPYYLRSENFIKKYNIEIDRYKKNIAGNTRIIEKYIEMAKQKNLPTVEKSFEYGPEIIRSMLTGHQATVYANVINNGLIDNLPADAAVEIKCLVDRSGIHPCRFGRLPTQCATLCSMNLNVHRLAAEAVLTHNKKAVVWAMMADPLTHTMLTIDQMEKCAEELFRIHEKFFNGVFN